MRRNMIGTVKIAFAVVIAGVMIAPSSAQELTVHVVTDSATPKPMAGVAVQLFPQPAMPSRRKVITSKIR